MVEPCSIERKVNIENFLQLFVHPIICFVGFIGNALVIVTYALYKRTKSMTDVYLLNVAIADILFVVALPLIIYSEQYEVVHGELVLQASAWHLQREPLQWHAAPGLHQWRSLPCHRTGPPVLPAAFKHSALQPPGLCSRLVVSIALIPSHLHILWALPTRPIWIQHLEHFWQWKRAICVLF